MNLVGRFFFEIYLIPLKGFLGDFVKFEYHLKDVEIWNY